MPHALFLGSSLAGIDRLDMLPLPPVSAGLASGSRSRSVKQSVRASLKALRRRGQRSKLSGSDAGQSLDAGTEIEIEMRAMPSLTGLGGPSNRVPATAGVAVTDTKDADADADADAKELAQRDLRNPRAPPSAPNGPLALADPESDPDPEHAAALKAYHAEMAAFDRVRWTELHLAHATVSLLQLYVGPLPF
jgi:hypothetical protein